MSKSRTEITKQQYDKNFISCELCDHHPKDWDTCEHPKNGYCALFRLQAAKDMVEFNMKTK